jgi:hypothetical protein
MIQASASPVSLETVSVCSAWSDENGISSEMQTESECRRRLAEDCLDQQSDKHSSVISATLIDSELPPSQERPQKVASERFRLVGLYFGTIHLPPILATLVLFALYRKGYYWNPDSNSLNFILLAAKIHESWIVASMSTILFDHIRRRLMDERGVPFGHLTSPFQVGNPLNLFGKAFISAASTLRSSPKAPGSLNFIRSSDATTTGLVIVVTVLALLSGPSSGIAMLPKLDWWPIPSDFPAVAGLEEMRSARDYSTCSTFGDMFISQDNAYGLYPLNVTSSIVSSVCDNNVTTFSNEAFCPGASTLALLNRLTTAFVAPNLAAPIFAFNLTLSAADLDFSYGLAESKSMYAKTVLGMVSDPSFRGRATTIAVATTPIDIIADYVTSAGHDWAALSQYPALIEARATGKDVSSSLKQPIVSVECSRTFLRWPVFSNPISHVVGQFNYPDTYKFHFGDGEKLSYQLEMPRNLTSNLDSRFQVVPTSLLTQWALARTEPFSTALVHQVPNENATDLCFVTGVWGESQVWVDLGVSNVPQFEAPSLLPGSDGLANLKAEDVIQMGEDWMQYLPDIVHNSSVIDVNCEALAVSRTPACRASMLALSLADALSRIPYFFQSYYNCPDNVPGNDRVQDGSLCTRSSRFTKTPIVSDVGDSNLTKISLEYFHHVSSYQFRGNMIYVAFAVLFIHLGIAFTHFWVSILKNAWTSRAWSELGELLAIALQTSPTPLLINTGSGVNSRRTWRLRTVVRVVEPENRLEFVLTDGAGTAMEDETDHTGRPVSTPKPGRKYG